MIATTNMLNIGVVSLYLLFLIALGFYSKKQKKNNSLTDFYLGGRDFSFIFLFLTFYATQYSGNTMIGFSGKAYRDGWIALSIVVFMIAAIGGILSYAPKLYNLSLKRNYITVVDYINDRYPHKFLHYLVIFVCVFVLTNYILSNLKAAGYIINMLSGGVISSSLGIIVAATIIFIYECLGGMRSVVFTDAIQGLLLFFIIQIIFFTVLYNYGFSSNIEPGNLVVEKFDIADRVGWISIIFLVFFSISVYPQAIQRIFMAKNVKVLRKSLKFMTIMPFFTTLPIILIAIIATSIVPDLDRTASDNIIIIMLNKLNFMGLLKIIVILFFVAVVAAIMSTIDSSNMAMHSMLVKNIYLRIKPQSKASDTIFMSKVFSLFIMVLLSYLAINIDSTIWIIIKIKLEVLAQLFPIIVLGVWSKKIKAESVLYGLLAGLITVAYLLLIASNINPFYIHAGLWGLATNFLVIGFFEAITRSRSLRVI